MDNKNNENTQDKLNQDYSEDKILSNAPIVPSGDDTSPPLINKDGEIPFAINPLLGMPVKNTPAKGSKRKPIKKRIAIISSIAVILAVTVSVLGFAGVLSSLADSVMAMVSVDDSDSDPGTVSLPSPEEHLGTVSELEQGGIDTGYSGPSSLLGAWLVPGADFYKSSDSTIAAASAEIDAALSKCKEYTFNSVIVPVSYNGGITADGNTVIPTTEFSAVLSHLTEKAKENSISVFLSLNLSAGELKAADSSTELCVAAAKAVAEVEGISGVLIDGYYIGDSIPYSDYAANGGGMGYGVYRRDRITNTIREVTSAIRAVNSGLAIVLSADPVWATKTAAEKGIDTNQGVFSAYSDGSADTLSWIESGFFNWVMVKNDVSTKASDLSFDKITKWWMENASEKTTVCFSHSANKAVEKSKGWESPDQLIKQMMAVKELNSGGSVFYSLTSLTGDNTGSTEALMKYISGQIGENYSLAELTFSSPSKTAFTTLEKSVTITGASDPLFPITLNGKDLERTELGFFSKMFDLSIGNNIFTFVHKGKTVTYNITFKQVILQDVAPTADQKLDGGSTLVVKATARTGSKVSAKLGDTTIQLECQQLTTENGEAPEFMTYTGHFSMPTNLTKNTNLGNIKFTGVYNGRSEGKNGGKVTVTALKPDVPLPEFSNTGGGNKDYINVGTKMVAEVVTYQAETFDGNIIDDRSRPTNNYLPKGTVDYCSESTITDAGSSYTYRLLAYGKRLYLTSKEKGENIKVYKGTLPETNSITINNVSESARFTTVTLDTQWKAPFKVDLSGQGYKDPYPKGGGAPNYNISKSTYDYVDITFCYTATAQGAFELADNHPIFKKAEWIKNANDYTLRLHLRKTGRFFGWNAEYNSSGQLVFTFLKPAKLSSASNDYGVSLKGVKIVLDPGHGGSDPGAVGSNVKFTEAVLNTKMSTIIAERLRALGAEVTMTHNMTNGGSERLGLDPRVLTTKRVKPDLFVSVHRNASENPSGSGYDSFYFNAFSQPLAQAMVSRNKGLYNSVRDSKWGNFYVMRVSDCPAILTENGFVSNPEEFGKIITDQHNKLAAEATVGGIVDYLKSIQ